MCCLTATINMKNLRLVTKQNRAWFLYHMVQKWPTESRTLFMLNVKQMLLMVEHTVFQSAQQAHQQILTTI